MKGLKEFKSISKYIGKSKYKLIFSTILILISEIIGIFQGYLNGSAVEEITKLNIISSLIFLGIYYVSSFIDDCVITNIAKGVLRNTENELTRKIGFNTYKKALDLPAYAYEKMSSGEVINRITNDSTTLSSTFEQLLYMFSSIIGAILVLVYVFFNSWIIGVEIVLFLIILYFVLKKHNPVLNDINKQIRKEKDNVVSVVNESVRGIREIKTLGIKKNIISDVSDALKELFKISKKEIDIVKKYRFFTRLLKITLEVGVFVTCVILLYYGEITLTFFVAMTYYVYRFMWLIENINEFSQTYQKVVVALSRVNEILENRLYKDEKFGNMSIRNIKGVVEFKDVCFAYPDEAPILANFNLKLEPNKKIAIVGKSGQGKSTLFNLLTRIFDPTSGVIMLDGVDIKTICEKSLRNYISIIRQEPFIFNRTIFENFKLLDKDIK